ncbi:MAG: hypothetical protein JXB00_10090 [Bacteroidales bacterium]|nr:hypothetical protein [Bacteroidales bacterium]
MARSKKNKDNDSEKLRKESEKLKKKLLEKGAVFSNEELNGNLPPDIENEFYKNIFAFENAYKNAKLTTVYDFIGKPNVKKEEELTDGQVSAELENITELMNRNGIFLDTICEVDARTLYKFITEELFQHEIEDVRIEGMSTNFIYEEFHPNHEYDIKNHCSDFITGLLQKNEYVLSTFLARESQEEGWFKQFTEAFSAFNLKHFEITKLNNNNEEALVTFDIDFTGTIEGTSIQQHYCGTGTAEMVYLYDFWCIKKVNFPVCK